ncbi:FH2 domain containing 3 isoform X1 [Xyrichtys novacula]|uniref:FH2 domain containing 3 isoform X1 n=1 Tax=Xyrichtys novacula TaxID=13765 RepID=A0AAV1FSW0_XYRNO|nr:FH2 domain containing 3 isoform X1 [Xyrichtys novacula]
MGRFHTWTVSFDWWWRALHLCPLFTYRLGSLKEHEASESDWLTKGPFHLSSLDLRDQMEGVLIVKSASDPNLSSLSSSFFLPSAEKDLDAQSSSSDPSAMCVTSVPPPPPPPPPPPLPPPPPPPPPPLLPPFGSRSEQRRSMKKLNWDTIPSQRVLGKHNVWTTKGTQRDLVLDIQSMEELFSHVDKRASIRNSRVMGLKNSEGLDLFPPEPQVTILDSKKSMNIGIFLKQFKRPVEDMVRDIQQGNWLRFGTGKLKELCKLLPEDGEVKQLQSFSGNLSVLPEADRFMVQLVKVPGYEERLKAMMLREEFFPLMEEVKNSVTVMTKGADELLNCDDLHSVIRLVLKAGNYMNAGGYSANAIGFRMTSLLKLADTKANKPGMNLMHYVAKQAEDIDAELLTFPSQLEHVSMASRICKEEVMSDFEREVKKIKEVKLYSSRHPGLLQQMESFFLRAEAKLVDVESSLQELRSVSEHVAEYYCEDPATFKLGECCSIFHSFCKRFEAAVLENKEREAAEERRKRRESVRISFKRRSTVSCPRSEPHQDDSSLESVLHNFLSTAPEGLSRCRKNTLPVIKGSPSVCSSKVVPLVGKPDPTPCTGQEQPEKKQPKQQKEEDPSQENKDEAEKMREVTLKVLQYQNSSEDKVNGTPRQSERPKDTQATPKTPKPRSRDFFFANNSSSPWTILSPLTCPQGTPITRNRRAHHSGRPLLLGGDNLHDEVWEKDFSHQGTQTSPSQGSSSLPECPSNRAVSQGPFLRSVSVDETGGSPVAHSRLGELFHRSISQRSHSSGSRTEVMKEAKERDWLGSRARNYAEGQVSTSGFRSFFRRIGGKTKLGDVDDQHFKGSYT